MHLILHIFKKDVRRLWWGIVVALALLVGMTYIDAAELNVPFSLLLILTWTCLIALAVHEDPLVGDRQFWVTRPLPWPVLLGSKLLFAVAIVHVPSFLSDVVILSARGFHPWEWLPSLLKKQIMLAAAITLPVIALAAVLQSFAQLALAIIAIVGLTTAGLFGFSPLLYSRWRGVDDTRVLLFFAVLAVAAGAIVTMQFARRRTPQSRMFGVAAVAVAELVLGCLSPIFLARVRAAIDPAHANIALRLSTRTADSDGITGWMRSYGDSGSIPVRLPLGVSGIPKGFGSLFDVTTVDLITPGNVHHEVRPLYIGPDWLLLQIPRPLYESIKNANVDLNGTVVVILHRFGPSTSMPVGVNRAVAGVGRCSSDIMGTPRYVAESQQVLQVLRVVCESPAGFPLAPLVALWEPGDKLGQPHQFPGLIGPWPESLSPIKLTETSFHLSQGPNGQISGRLEITPDLSQGWQVVNLELRGIRLADYALR